MEEEKKQYSAFDRLDFNDVIYERDRINSGTIDMLISRSNILSEIESILCVQAKSQIEQAIKTLETCNNLPKDIHWLDATTIFTIMNLIQDLNHYKSICNNIEIDDIIETKEEEKNEQK